MQVHDLRILDVGVGDLESRVFSNDHQIIRGLYAAGEAAGFGGGGVHGYRSLAGTFL
ncbi:FAD-binding protein, partial [Bradyrhizobium brasilense]|uniref:FAD-binding protein n=1 Tax=Bradyrhizobium brasilense TaxID=1419277 RepID=UPI003D31A4F6